jgi:hypothetical protein
MLITYRNHVPKFQMGCSSTPVSPLWLHWYVMGRPSFLPLCSNRANSIYIDSCHSYTQFSRYSGYNECWVIGDYGLRLSKDVVTCCFSLKSATSLGIRQFLIEWISEDLPRGWEWLKLVVCHSFSRSWKTEKLLKRTFPQALWEYFL